ncbi:MAG: sugar phosphate nucleotidyltransferase, partial [Thermodesulfobacteriota bacterium]
QGTLYSGGSVLFLKSVKDPERFCVAEIKGRKIIDITEKPSKPVSDKIITGLYIYPNDVFNVIKDLKPSKRGELEITDVNNHYVKAGKCKYIDFNGFWSDAGTFGSLLKSANWVKAYE